LKVSLFEEIPEAAIASLLDINDEDKENPK
jgi:hypothetical protein